MNFSLVKNLRSFSESDETVLSFFLQYRSHKKNYSPSLFKMKLFFHADTLNQASTDI